MGRLDTRHSPVRRSTPRKSKLSLSFPLDLHGLHAQIGREQLAEIAAAYADPQMAADMLVRAALNAGGRDNITVIVVDMRSDMPCDEDWNVSKIGDDEDIDDALDGTLQTLRVIQ